MIGKRITNIKGLNLYNNPFERDDGELIRAVNVTSDSYGAKSKRGGYSTFLGTANGSTPTTLFSFYRNDGTAFWLYRSSGALLYYSAQGTGAWSIAGNGTITAGNHIGHAVLDNTMILGDGAGSTRHTTDGTSFTNTTAAPVGEYFEQYQNRIYIGGTSSSLFYSTTGTASDWSGVSPSDSSSLTIPGSGKMGKIFKCNDRLVITKNSGAMHRWDGYSLTDMSNKMGPSSPYSLSEIDGYFFWLNRLGLVGYGGNRPELLSNAIEKQIYNRAGSAIEGTVFDTAPGGIHRYDYFAAVGTLTDDLTNETVANCILKYDFKKNEWLNWKFANLPTAFLSYKDTSGDDQLIFGASGGQCYKYDPSSTSDNGTAIESVMEFVLHLGVPEIEKEWKWLWAYFNPGCSVKVQVAFANSFTRDGLRWIELDDFQDGIFRYRFPSNSRSRLLFVKIYESSSTKGYTFYGFSVDADEVPI